MTFNQINDAKVGHKIIIKLLLFICNIFQELHL